MLNHAQLYLTVVPLPEELQVVKLTRSAVRFLPGCEIIHYQSTFGLVFYAGISIQVNKFRIRVVRAHSAVFNAIAGFHTTEGIQVRVRTFEVKAVSLVISTRVGHVRRVGTCNDLQCQYAEGLPSHCRRQEWVAEIYISCCCFCCSHCDLLAFPSFKKVDELKSMQVMILIASACSRAALKCTAK
jgi:hypothetical protein